jgi:putative membrane protein
MMMTAKFGMAALLALGFACAGTSAAMAQAGTTPKSSATKSSKASTETHFIKEAIQGNLAEVKMGKLGEEKGTTADIRDFGKRLVTDHSAANDKAKAAAQKAGVTPPTEPTKKQTETYQSLSKLSGSKFDRRYIEDMVKDHKKDIAEYKRAAKAGAGPVADYAQNALPTLQEHLRIAEKIEKSQKNGTGAKKSGNQSK